QFHTLSLHDALPISVMGSPSRPTATSAKGCSRRRWKSPLSYPSNHNGSNSLLVRTDEFRTSAPQSRGSTAAVPTNAMLFRISAPDEASQVKAGPAELPSVL